MSDSERKSVHDGDERFENLKFSLHDFLVDLLGGLIPGILFTIATFFALIPPLRALLVSISPKKDAGKEEIEMVSLSTAAENFFESIQNTPNMIWIGLFLFSLILSYVFGHLFYRKDPKVPDRKSFLSISKKNKPTKEELDELYPGESDEDFNKKNGRSREIDHLRKSFGCDSAQDCEFPYPHLDYYLRERGHDHLLPLVKWSEKKEHRSKTYINRLKIRLAFHNPDKYRRIVRNEAHVRLATSTWYVGMNLLKFGLTGFVIVLMAGAFYCWRHGWEMSWDAGLFFTESIISPIVVITVAVFAKYAIEQFIHYQRLREVFYVLELAYTTFRDKEELLKSPIIWFYDDPKPKVKEEKFPAEENGHEH